MLVVVCEATRTATLDNDVAIVILQKGEVGFRLVLVNSRGVFDLLLGSGKVSTQGSDRGCVGFALGFQVSLLIEEFAVFRLDLHRAIDGSVELSAKKQSSPRSESKEDLVARHGRSAWTSTDLFLHFNHLSRLILSLSLRALELFR